LKIFYQYHCYFDAGESLIVGILNLIM